MANVDQSVDQPSGETKKKNKKHKKDKKNKKHKRSSPIRTDDRSIPDASSLFDAPSDSNDPHGSVDSTAASAKYGTPIASQSAGNKRWHDSGFSNSEFNFGSSFSQSDENVVIQIGSSDGSNSPPHNPSASYPQSRTSSPPFIPQPAMQKRPSAGLTDDPHFWQQQAPAAPVPPFNEPSTSLSFSESSSTMPAYNEDAPLAVPVEAAPVTEPQPAVSKKRGRKKGSKGIDTQLGGKSLASNQQSGTQYFDSMSLSTLKDKMESIRGASKKVKTINELVAHLGIMRNLSTFDDDDTVDEPPSRASYSECFSPSHVSNAVHFRWQRPRASD